MPKDVEIEIAVPATLVTPSNEETILNELKAVMASNVKITFLGRSRSTPFKRLAFPWDCREFLKPLASKGEYDIIHSASTQPDFLLSPRKLSMPLVSTVHTTVEGHWQSLRSMRSRYRDLSSSEKLVLLFGPVLSLAEKSYYTNSRHYITVSEWAKRTMVREKRVDPDKIRVIYIGVDSNKFSPDRKREAREIYSDLLDVEKPKVLYLSRMATRKGIGLLLRAVPKILEKVDVHFIFAGAGKRPDFNIPKQSYTYLGPVPHDHPPLLYSSSDVFVLPSLYENFPACILEAMASECAVVSTNICGIPEMIRQDENGLMIPPNDADEISRAIVRLVEDDDLRKRIGRRARMDVTQTFSWKRSSETTREFYEEVIGHHRQHRGS